MLVIGTFCSFAKVSVKMSKRARSKLKRKVTKSDPKPSENDNQERPMENGEGELPKAIGNTEGQELNDKLLKLCKPFVIRVRRLNANSLKRLMNDGDSKRKPSKENKTAEKNETTEHTENLTHRKRSRKNSKGIKPTTRRSKTSKLQHFYRFLLLKYADLSISIKQIRLSLSN